MVIENIVYKWELAFLYYSSSPDPYHRQTIIMDKICIKKNNAQNNTQLTESVTKNLTETRQCNTFPTHNCTSCLQEKKTNTKLILLWKRASSG